MSAELRHGGVRADVALTRWLLECQRLAVLAGSGFGDDPAGLRFRAATSLLHGSTVDQHRASVEATDPLSVPHVRHALDRLDDVLARVTERQPR